MKKIITTLGVSLLLCPVASAADVAPQDVTVSGMAVDTSLTGTAGDPAAGREIFSTKSEGNCLACHTNSEIENAQFPGNVGRTMDGVASRWEPAQLRAILVNSKAVFGKGTIMPGFYTLDVGIDVADEYKGKTILSAAEIEDVVAYLATLKGE